MFQRNYEIFDGLLTDEVFCLVLWADIHNYRFYTAACNFLLLFMYWRRLSHSRTKLYVLAPVEQHMAHLSGQV